MSVIGYTTGVFDLFHVGHLNILKRAKEQCDYLVVGVTVDELVAYKGKKAFIPFEERFAIVEAIKYVDKVVPQTSMTKWKPGTICIFIKCSWATTGREPIPGTAGKRNSQKSAWRSFIFRILRRPRLRSCGRH